MWTITENNVESIPTPRPTHIVIRAFLLQLFCICVPPRPRPISPIMHIQVSRRCLTADAGGIRTRTLDFIKGRNDYQVYLLKCLLKRVCRSSLICHLGSHEPGRLIERWCRANAQERERDGDPSSSLLRLQGCLSALPLSLV